MNKYKFEITTVKLNILNLIIKAEKDNKIIAFQSESGSGKSNLIKEVINELKLNNQYECIYFNPLEKNSTKKILESLFEVIKEIMDSEITIKYEDYISNTKDFSNFKKFINNEITKKNKKHFIFIDDIDSLDSKIIKQLLKLIKYNLDFENLTYVLNYDEEAMQSSLVRYFGKKGEYLSYIYLNKIVDSTFNIKIASKSELVEYVIKETENIIKENNLIISQRNLKKFRSLFKELYKEKLKTLREANKYLNNINTLNLNNEQNICNELIKEGIRMFYSKVYKNIDIKDECIDEHSIRIAIEEFKRDGKVSSVEDRALLIEKTIESLLCERE